MKIFNKMFEEKLHYHLIHLGAFLVFFGLFMQYAQEMTAKQTVWVGVGLFIFGLLIPMGKKKE